jgi:hypothetical protein
MHVFLWQIGTVFPIFKAWLLIFICHASRHSLWPWRLFVQPRTQVLNLRSYLAWIQSLVSAGHVTHHVLANLLNCFRKSIVSRYCNKHWYFYNNITNQNISVTILSLKTIEKIRQNMTVHVTSRYQGLNSSEVGAKIENLGTRCCLW